MRGVHIDALTQIISVVERIIIRALVATLLGLLISNIGLIPCDAPQYAVVNKMLLPLAIPMLLFSADLRYCSLCQRCRPLANCLVTALILLL